MKSPFGRMIEAIRDNEDAVKALGKDPARFKIQVLVLGAVLAGLSGGFYAITSVMFRPTSSCRS